MVFSHFSPIRITVKRSTRTTSYLSTRFIMHPRTLIGGHRRAFSWPLYNRNNSKRWGLVSIVIRPRHNYPLTTKILLVTKKKAIPKGWGTLHRGTTNLKMTRTLSWMAMKRSSLIRPVMATFAKVHWKLFRRPQPKRKRRTIRSGRRQNLSAQRRTEPRTTFYPSTTRSLWMGWRGGRTKTNYDAIMATFQHRK